MFAENPLFTAVLERFTVFYALALTSVKMLSVKLELYKQLDPSLKCKRYELRSTYTGYVTNIGSYDRQYPYKETDFYHFDEFLFTTWRDKPNGKGKDEIPWGIEI